MGRRGPAPKPDELKALEGNPGKRPLNLDAAQPEGIPKCPSHLCRDAKNEWRRISGELARLGLLTVVDRTALAIYCDAYAKWTQATKVIDLEGMTMEYVTKTGSVNIIARPEVGISQKYAQIIKAFCAEFGLTPSARCRLTLPKEEDLDPFESDFN